MHGFWGYHLIIDASGLKCPVDDMNDITYLKAFIKDMLEAVDMTAWGEPMIMRLTEKDGDFPDHLSGYTIVQLLHTSNMTVHLCDKVGTLYFDLFSCKCFNNDDAINIIKSYFQPESIRVNFLTRNA
jgi:S-adenosylmethionine/arginine decarboxylase-like enzyme